jgi:hypothetical protein
MLVGGGRQHHRRDAECGCCHGFSVRRRPKPKAGQARASVKISMHAEIANRRRPVPEDCPEHRDPSRHHIVGSRSPCARDTVQKTLLNATLTHTSIAPHRLFNARGPSGFSL